MELFPEKQDKPLALRVAPRSFEDIVGQEHILGPGKLLRQLIETKTFRAGVFFGPPGTGKTSTARVIARTMGGKTFYVNASVLKPKDLTQCLEAAEKHFQSTGKRALVFVDEIHRFNRRNQEVLLARLEKGGLVFIGSTVHNPAFALSKALLSRVLLFEFKQLGQDAVLKALVKAAEKEGIEVETGALEIIARSCEGDLRRALNYLEAGIATGRTNKTGIAEVIETGHLRFDKTGDERYDMISALIKSIRGSDPDAASYWFVRLIDAGEDPNYIIRRLLVHASEDIGLADSGALVLAQAAAAAFDRVGRPEGDIILTHAVLRLATAAKSNAVVKTLGAVRKAISQGQVYPVPQHLADAHYASAKKLGKGVGYKYTPEDPGPQEFLPPQLRGKRFFPGIESGDEKGGAT